MQKDEGEDSEGEVDDEEEKITRNWSVLKNTPQLRKSKVIVFIYILFFIMFSLYMVDKEALGIKHLFFIE